MWPASPLKAFFFYENNKDLLTWFCMTELTWLGFSCLPLILRTRQTLYNSSFLLVELVHVLLIPRIFCQSSLWKLLQNSKYIFTTYRIQVHTLLVHYIITYCNILWLTNPANKFKLFLLLSAPSGETIFLCCWNYFSPTNMSMFLNEIPLLHGTKSIASTQKHWKWNSEWSFHTHLPWSLCLARSSLLMKRSWSLSNSQNLQ